MTDNDNTKTYAFADTQNEMKRLEEQSKIIGPTTRRVFENAGIAAGMKVLDIGSGAGDVAMMLAEMVGPGGSVVGVDKNPVMAEAAGKRVREKGYENITFIAGDPATLELDHDFDALVGRAVLMYIPQPEEFLKAVLKHVRPGGIVAFQEVDFTIRPVAIPMLPLYKKAWDWFYSTMEKSGTEMQMGFKLLETYMKAGLPEPGMHLEAFVGGASSPGLDWFISTIRSIIPTMEKLGVATAEEVGIDTLKTRMIMQAIENKAITSVGMSNTWIGAWARKATL